MRKRSTILGAAILALAAAVPLVVGEFYINLVSQILIAAIFAASLNLLVGYGGLSSLGHASFLGFSAYACAWTSLTLGLGQGVTAVIALGATTMLAAVFGIIALRVTGVAFLMITLALSQVLWGLAYRWVSMTNGDNGLAGLHRPMPFGLSLEEAAAFYWFTLLVTLIALVLMAIFAGSAFGASLKATRDEPRRTAALGFDVWLIRWITFIYAGFWGGVAGLLYVYYHHYIHPSSLSITASAEGLLTVIAGGSGTFGGPIVGAALVTLLKNYASAYVERWSMLMGFVFLIIVVVLPEGIVPGVLRLIRRSGGGR